MRAERSSAMSDERQSPLGFFNLGISYFEAADALTERHFDQDDPYRATFEHPIRHMYAHGWELIQKACLFRQGTKPRDLRRRFGHALTPAWDAIDKARFAPLNFDASTRLVAEALDAFHSTKLYAYPIVGYRRELSIPYLRAATGRFRLDRPTVIDLFGCGVTPQT